MNKQKFIEKQRLRRRRGVRRKVRGDAQRPRLSVFRSLRHISAQVIDDTAGKTLVAASTCEKPLRDELAKSGNKEAAAAVGTLVAQRALEAGIKSVRMDRAHCKYHGRVAALADAAREAGLGF